PRSESPQYRGQDRGRKSGRRQRRGTASSFTPQEACGAALGSRAQRGTVTGGAGGGGGLPSGRLCGEPSLAAWRRGAHLPRRRHPPQSELELLASTLRNGGFEALFAHALEQRRIGLRLDDPIELAAIGRDEAHTVDLEVVDTPATLPEVQAIVERDLGAPLSLHLRPHRGEARVDGLARIGDVLTRIR